MTQRATAPLPEPSRAAVSDDPIPRFVEENAKFWLPFTDGIERTSDKCILVDIMISDPRYFIGNATVAKYLQSFMGCDIAALIPAQNQSIYRRLAQSFGIRRTITEPAHSQPNQKIMAKVKQILNHINDGNLKERLLDLKIDSLSVGDLIYDSYIRHSKKSELSSIDDVLVGIIYDALVRFDHYSRMLRELDVAATVQGHVVYQRYGFLARLALRQGASVFGRKSALSRFTVRHYRSLMDGNQYEYRFSQQEFDLIWDGYRDLAVAGGREHLAKRFSGQHDDRCEVQAFGIDKKLYNRQELTALLGLSPDRPTAFIMPHVLCDAPHTDSWFLYPDFHEWLVETLKGAVANNRVNWVIKPHPSERSASGDTTARQVAAPFVDGTSHMAFAPADLNTAAVPQLADAIVTGNGTAGVELAAMGIPAILAGETPYSGFGFTVEPTSREEYQNLLATIEDLPRLTDEQTERAVAYLYLYMELSRVKSALVPDLERKPDYTVEDYELSLLVEATDLIRGFRSVEEDPVYVNFKKQFESGAEHILNFDWLGV